MMIFNGTRNFSVFFLLLVRFLLRSTMIFKILLSATKLEIENLILMSLFIHIENNIILLLLFLFLII